MGDNLHAAWRQAREKELDGWKLDALVERRNQLGLRGRMNPKETYSLVTAIAAEESRRLREGATLPPPMVSAVPGAVLDDPEEDVSTLYADSEFAEDYTDDRSEPPKLDENFRPNKALRLQMYDYLVARYGAAVVDAMEFPWSGVQYRVEPMEDQVIKAMDAMKESHHVPLVAEEFWHNKILLNVDPREMRTQSADFIVNTILPAVLSHFLKKNAEYGDRHRHTRSGIKGECCGLDRKMDKVWDALWDGKPMQFEQPDEMLFDIIGQCFLMLDLMARDESMPDPAAY